MTSEEHAATYRDGVPAQFRLQVSDTVVARVAAYHACRVPGVLRLRPNLAQSMTGIAGRLLASRDSEYRIPTDGVTAVVDGGRAEISVSVITRWGCNCRDLAEQIQRQVAGQVLSYTGLAATVSVTITDVDYWS